MKEVKKCAVIILAATLIYISIFCVSVFLLPDAYSDSYNKGFMLQYRALQNSASETDSEGKIIIFGGSYVPFGIDLEYLEELTGRDCYSIGVAAGMGIPYIVETMSPYISSGDIVVMPLAEFDPDNYGMETIFISIDGQKDLLKQFVLNHPKEAVVDGHLWVVTKLYGSIVSPIIEKVRGVVLKTENRDNAYNIEKFDGRGNYIKNGNECLVSESELAKRSYFSNGIFNEKHYEYIRKLNEFCVKRGARLVLTFAPNYINSYTNSHSEFQSEMSEIKSHLGDICLISDVESALYEKDDLYNAVAHLNANGQRKYTLKLAEDLDAHEIINMNGEEP